MKSKEIIEIAEKIISGRMELDYLSSLYGTVIFRQDREYISENELQQIQSTLLANGIYSQTQKTTKEYLLRLLLDYSKVKKENTRINLILFIITIITTTLTGAMLIGSDPFLTLEGLAKGFPYAVAILSILGAHEMGHYLYAKKYRIYATLPYFIPFFIPAFNIGTLGAFIKIRSPIPDKKALFDVGVAGPIAGFVVSLFFLFLGFSLLPDLEGVKDYVTQIHDWSETGEDALTLGNPILFDLIRKMMGGEHLPMYEVYHFPFIFAGWIGLFVTALNLMPIGQLDGGHISYALLGKKAKFVAIGAFIALALLNFYSTNWILWTILILLVIRLKHPPTLNDSIELDSNRRTLAWISYIIFVTCFSPMPLYFS
ncbi:MAG: site-2 protease family protein [Calditrichia bacterium]|nr:site-2 protease family protein [Calditrichia bacterium]